jgi:hypothetical protein
VGEEYRSLSSSLCSSLHSLVTSWRRPQYLQKNSLLIFSDWMIFQRTLFWNPVERTKGRFFRNCSGVRVGAPLSTPVSMYRYNTQTAYYNCSEFTGS